MPWIADVVPQTTIRSVWGNQIRDRVVHQYASTGERDAAPGASRIDGALCATNADRRIWQYRGDLGIWVILSEPWQGYAPTCAVGPSNTPIQTDMAESKMVGDLVTIRFLVKALNGAVGNYGTFFVSLPPSRGNAGPEQTPGGGVMAATDFATGLTVAAAPILELGRFYGRKMTDWSATGPTAQARFGDYAYQGTFTYKASGYGP